MPPPAPAPGKKPEGHGHDHSTPARAKTPPDSTKKDDYKDGLAHEHQHWVPPRAQTPEKKPEGHGHDHSTPARAKTPPDATKKDDYKDGLAHEHKHWVPPIPPKVSKKEEPKHSHDHTHWTPPEKTKPKNFLIVTESIIEEESQKSTPKGIPERLSDRSEKYQFFLIKINHRKELPPFLKAFGIFGSNMRLRGDVRKKLEEDFEKAL